MEEMGGGERDVDVARLSERLAAVHRLDDRELARAFLDQPGDPEQVLGPLELVSAAHFGYAERAASTAAITSSGPPSATSAIGCSVAGLIVDT